MPQKIINFSSQLLKKLFVIFIFFVGFTIQKCSAQSMSARDSLKYKIRQKKATDSTRIALRKIAIQKRQDSIQTVIKLRQKERIRKADSTRKARLEARQAERKRNKAYQLRKKTRQEIRDSIAAASKKAALARKAYLKKQKKKKKSPPAKKSIVKKNSDAKKKVKPKKVVAKKKIAQQQKPKKRKKRRKDIPIVTKNKREKKVRTTEPKKKVVKTKKTKKEPKKKKVVKVKKAQNKKLEKSPKKKITKNKTKTKKTVETKTNVSKVKKQRIASIYPEEKIVAQFFKREKVIAKPEKKKTYFSFQLGQSNYLGDLGGGTRINQTKLGDLDFKENTFFYGFSLSQLRKEAVGIRLSYVFGKIAGSDKNTFYKDEDDPAYSRFVRNLDFRTAISEGSLLFEIYPFKFLSYQKKLHNSYFQPYVLFGVGRYSFNPQGSYFDPILEEDVWVDLQPLSLEGQGMAEHPDREPYKTSQWNLPLGIGLQYEISRTVGLSIEYVGRVLSTDYLDDVSTSYIQPDLFDKYLNNDNAELAKILNNKSQLVDANRAYLPGQQRGDPDKNDFYFSIVAKLSIKINRNKKKSKRTRFNSVKYDDNEICE